MLIQKFIKRWYNFFRMRSPKIAIIIHAHHLNVLGEIFDYVQNVPGNFDLFLNFSHISHSQKKMIDKIKKDLKKAIPGECYFTTSNNRGQDLGGFFASTAVAREKKLSYDLICKIHTKADSEELSSFKTSIVSVRGRTIRSRNLTKTEWRMKLFSSLLGSKRKVTNILKTFQTYPSVGMISCKTFYGRHDFNENKNMRNYLFFKKKMNLPDVVCYPHNKYFLAGTMFWMKGDVWDFLMEQDITIHDFEVGANNDGLRSHAFERMFDSVVKSLGYTPWMIEP